MPHEIVAPSFMHVYVCVRVRARNSWASSAVQLKRSIQSLLERYRESKLKSNERSHPYSIANFTKSYYSGKFYLQKSGNPRFSDKNEDTNKNCFHLISPNVHIKSCVSNGQELNE